MSWTAAVTLRAVGPVSYEVVLPDSQVLHAMWTSFCIESHAATTTPEPAVPEWQLESDPAELSATNG